MKEKTIKTIMISLTIVFLLFTGWTVHDLFDRISYKRPFDGAYLRSWNESAVDDFLNEESSVGNWVVVNIRGMSPERALEVCKHEVGHEIFAEHCEGRFDECMEVVK